MQENWCKLFNHDENPVLAYFNDLKDYWVKSYGNEINSKVVISIYRDLFHQFEKHIKNETNRHKVLIRVGHAENIIPLITALGLFKDSDGLKYDNFLENFNRKFKGEVISPFAANVAFVLHKCNHSSDNSDDIYKRYKVNLLVNELPVGMIGAGDLECALNQKGEVEKSSHNGSFCDYSAFKSQLYDFISQDLNETCKPRFIDPSSQTNVSLASKNEL